MCFSVVGNAMQNRDIKARERRIIPSFSFRAFAGQPTERDSPLIFDFLKETRISQNRLKIYIIVSFFTIRMETLQANLRKRLR